MGNDEERSWFHIPKVIPSLPIVRGGGDPRVESRVQHMQLERASICVPLEGAKHHVRKTLVPWLLSAIMLGDRQYQCHPVHSEEKWKLFLEIRPGLPKTSGMLGNWQ